MHNTKLIIIVTVSVVLLCVTAIVLLVVFLRKCKISPPPTPSSTFTFRLYKAGSDNKAYIDLPSTIFQRNFNNKINGVFALDFCDPEKLGIKDAKYSDGTAVLPPNTSFPDIGAFEVKNTTSIFRFTVGDACIFNYDYEPPYISAVYPAVLPDVPTDLVPEYRHYFEYEVVSLPR